MARNATAFEVPYNEERMPAGAYYFVLDHETSEKRGIVHGCPCGCGLRSILFFEGKADARQTWKVEGEWPKVSLTPSIGMFHGQNPYHWHGYLRAGVFEEC